MKLRDLLQQLQDLQKKIGASQPMICGGTPRDKYLNQLEKVEDIDITTGDKTIDYLSQQFALVLNKKYKITRKVMDDGHSTIYIGDLKLDFSSNFVVPGIDAYLTKFGIIKPTDMQKEMFSRDFTCNALLLSMDLKNITDPTGMGFKDIKERKIKTCLAPDVTLTAHKNRTIRAVYIASKLDFDIDPSIIEFVKKNPQLVTDISASQVSKKLNKAFAWDADRAAYNLTKMNLWSYIPVTEEVYPYYIKHIKKEKVAYFQGGGDVNEPTPKKKKYRSEPALVNQPRFEELLYRNYDLYETEGVNGPAKHGPGTGFYQNMEKYKSVSDFIKKKRKRNKGKYVAEDSYIQDDGSVTKTKDKKKKKRARRCALFLGLTKQACDENNIDFPSDSLNSTPMAWSPDVGDAAQIGGYLDKYLPEDDFEGKPPTTLDFGRDYSGPPLDMDEYISELLEQFEKHVKIPKPQEPDLFGLPDGISPKSDLDSPSEEDPEYGIMDSGTEIYNKMWI